MLKFDVLSFWWTNKRRCYILDLRKTERTFRRQHEKMCYALEETCYACGCTEKYKYDIEAKEQYFMLLFNLPSQVQLFLRLLSRLIVLQN